MIAEMIVDDDDDDDDSENNNHDIIKVIILGNRVTAMMFAIRFTKMSFENVKMVLSE